MQFHPVSSSNVSHVGFENGVIGVRFKNGSEYNYHGFTQHDHSALLHAESIGRHLSNHIKLRATHVKKIA